MKRRPDVFKIINLELEVEAPDLSILHPIFADGVTQRIVEKMPRPKKSKFKEVMYANAVIDPEQAMIIRLCREKGIEVVAVKVGYRFYGKKVNGLYVNKLVHVAYTSEPKLETLKPRGVRVSMQQYNLIAMSDAELVQLSKDRELHLALPKMKRLASFQARLGLSKVTDVFLETFAGAWSEHCFHDLWKSLGLFKMLKDTTARIDNPNLISAFVDNSGVWDLYDGLCILFKLETHNSPTKKEAYGGQLTKIGGDIRDVIENGLGAKAIALLEHTVLGELERKRYPELKGKTWPEALLGRETIRAIADYGNPMGIPMALARMMSHPDFSGKPFALGGTFGITTMAAAKKGAPRQGDFAILVGGKTGNDGLHGATISSSGITEHTDSGDSTHVQIGLPYTEQLMMRAGLELRDNECCSARNDFGALGVVSAFGEMGSGTVGTLPEKIGGLVCNLALVKLKCMGLANWQIAVSESQERFAHAVKPEKLETAIAIYQKYGLEYSIIGRFEDSGRFRMFYDPNATELEPNMPLSGEICLDIPYSFLDESPLTEVEVREPALKPNTKINPTINRDNIMEMGLAVVGHFDVCNQAIGTTQYDSTVQGITFQGPLYGKDYNIGSSLAVMRPVYGKPFGMTISTSFSPWQFEVDPVNAAIGAAMDTLVTQVIAGVKPPDIALADNFYMDGSDPESCWYLREQVKALTNLTFTTGTPLIVGKDSSAGKGTFGGRTVRVPPSVAITGMGKTPDVQKLILHQWQQPGNLLYAIGHRAERLDGSILCSSLGITGHQLDGFPSRFAKHVLDRMYRLSQTGIICSAVPVNRGGIFLRLFEGIEASGFGVNTMLCSQLFPESMGSVLVEIPPETEKDFMSLAIGIGAMKVGTIMPKKTFVIQDCRLNLTLLRAAWNRRFKEALWGHIKEEEKEMCA